MVNGKGLFGSRIETAEAVSVGHPDKVADTISDLVADLYIKRDRDSRTAIETAIKVNDGLTTVVLLGEVSSKAEVSEEVIRLAINCYLGYLDTYTYHSVNIINRLSIQSPEISQLVDGSRETGAGDQGTITGYWEYGKYHGMPVAYGMAAKLMEEYRYLASGNREVLKPDAKCQFTIDKETKKVIDVQLSHQVSRLDDGEEFKDALKDKIKVTAAINGYKIKGTGIRIVQFVEGGAEADAGVTGRKVVADQYGATIPVGGGAFSGKDLSKVDRSGAYWARMMAKKLAHEYKQSVFIQMSFAIGKATPVSYMVRLGDGTMLEPERVKTVTVREMINEVNQHLNICGLDLADCARLQLVGAFK